MRVPAMLMILAIPTPVIAGGASSQSMRAPAATSASRCPHVTSYWADRSGSYRGQPLRPQKLTQLPPGTAYMAVDRHIGLCEDPLTMADYRSPRQR